MKIQNKIMKVHFNLLIPIHKNYKQIAINLNNMSRKRIQRYYIILIKFLKVLMKIIIMKLIVVVVNLNIIIRKAKILYLIIK